MLSARIRKWGFWASDFLQGAPVRKHCADIEAELASGPRSTDRLEALLQFAVEHAPFYSACKGFRSLQDFPVINKATIKENYDAFRSDAFPGGRLYLMHASGSTGTPFTVLQDRNKRNRVFAEMICFGRRAGYEVGDVFVFTRVWTRHNRKRWDVALRENAIMFDISALDEERLESLGSLLRADGRIRCMLGYPSTFLPLTRHLDQRGEGPEAYPLRSVICISEHLPRHLRERLQSRFGCTVVSRYSNQENGVLAQQCPGLDEFHLNTASYVFEFLKLDEDTAAGPGDRARVVVTDLFNRAMPMIRYDTGDVAIRQASAACGWMTATLQEIEGRRLEFIYDTEDRLLSPAVVCNHFWSYTRLKQYQFIQEGRGQYRLLLNGAVGHYRDEEFIGLVKGFLGTDASVTLEHVDQIPQLASGKFISVVSRYRPS